MNDHERRCRTFRLKLIFAHNVFASFLVGQDAIDDVSLITVLYTDKTMNPFLSVWNHHFTAKSHNWYAHIFAFNNRFLSWIGKTGSTSAWISRELSSRAPFSWPHSWICICDPSASRYFDIDMKSRLKHLLSTISVQPEAQLVVTTDLAQSCNLCCDACAPNDLWNNMILLVSLYLNSFRLN